MHSYSHSVMRLHERLDTPVHEVHFVFGYGNTQDSKVRTCFERLAASGALRRARRGCRERWALGASSIDARVTLHALLFGHVLDTFVPSAVP